MGAMIHEKTVEEALESRRSIRQYEDREIEEDKRFRLGGRIATINRQVGLHIQAVWNEEGAFRGLKAKYGRFSGARNYLAMVGPKKGLAGDGLPVEQAIGYYGEELVLLATQLGLGTCWIGGTFSKGRTKYELEEGEQLHLIIALGYPAKEGASRKSKTMKQVSNCTSESPEWFAKGVATALLAPTAINQQKFHFELLDVTGETPAGQTGETPAGQIGEKPLVRAKSGRGPFSDVDLGIARYHFALGAGTENFCWEDKAAPAVPPPKNAVFREPDKEMLARAEAINPAGSSSAAGGQGNTPENGAGYCSGCGGCWGEDSGRRCTLLRR